MNTPPISRPSVCEKEEKRLEATRTDSHGSKVTAEDCLSDGLHVRYPLVQKHHYRKPFQQQYEYGQNNEPPHAERQCVIVEFVKRHPRPDEHKCCNVEQQVDNGAKIG